MTHRLLFASLSVAVSLFLAAPARPQAEIPTRVTVQNRTGELPFSTNVGTSIEHVDVATGTLNVRIPIGNVPGRGMNSGLYLQFNSNYFLLAQRIDSMGNPYFIWTIPVYSGWQTNHPDTSAAFRIIQCDPLPGGGNGGKVGLTDSYIYHDEDGGEHPLAVQQQLYGGSCAGPTDSPNPDLSGAGMLGSVSNVITADGTVVGNYSSSWEDANGNQKSWSATGEYIGTQVNTTVDTLGRPFFTSTSTSDSQGHPLTTTYTVYDSSGTAQNYVVNWTTINYQTAFNNGTGGYGAEYELTTQWFVISSVQLPNGTSYVFHYDNGAYGEITEIDLPTGGVITYTYANIQDNLLTRRAVATRTETVNGISSTWTFSIAANGGYEVQAYTSTVTYPAVGAPPVANQSVFTSVGGAITDAQIYAGTAQGTPLREYKMVYVSDTDPYADDACYDLQGNLPPLVPQLVGQRVVSITTILDNGLQSQKQFDYETFTYVYHPNHCTFVSPGVDSKVAKTYTTSRGNVTEIREYDWGQGAPGPLIRKTDNVYGLNSNSNYLSPNIVNKVTQQTVYDASSNQKAQTQYEYDNYVSGQNALISTNSNKAPQHDYTNYSSTFTYRGNATRVKKWRNRRRPAYNNLHLRRSRQYPRRSRPLRRHEQLFLC
jgi:hypothetical protein